MLERLVVDAVHVWRNRARLRWEELDRQAREAGEGAVLGFFLELTGDLGKDRALVATAAVLQADRASAPTFFFTPSARSLVGPDLAAINTPPVARRWGFLMNMPVDSFESLFRKHVGVDGL